MTDKLAEAIAVIVAYQRWRRGDVDDYNINPSVIGVSLDTITKAARAYHALPVVDEDLYRNSYDILNLRKTYPDGLRWAK